MQTIVSTRQRTHRPKSGGDGRSHGYIKPEAAKTYDDWQKDPAAAPVLQDGLSVLKETLNCSAVADMFNVRGVPVGPYCRRKSWDGAMVRRLFANPILKGQAGRGYRRTIKHHESGRRISVRNPDGPAFRVYPHLMHIEPVEFDELNRRLDSKNEAFRRRRVNGVDPLIRVPRKRTRFPGQHATCWFCGRQYVWGGNGVSSNLQCSGARQWRCWNSVGIRGTEAASRIVEVITSELYQLDAFDAQFAELVESAKDGSDSTASREKLRRDAESLALEKENLSAAIAARGPQAYLLDKIDEIAERERQLILDEGRIELQSRRELQLPKSIGELRGLFEKEFSKLAVNSPEMGQFLRQLVPEFHVYLVRLCDGGHLLSRARVKLSLAGIVPDAQRVPGLTELLVRHLSIDLFTPPQRERIREETVALAAQNVPQRQIMASVSESVTLPAVQDALALDRKMKALGLTSPYVMLQEPPEDSKLRRQMNPKYRFEPLDGYVRPSL